jgi:hypothetical protein
LLLSSHRRKVPHMELLIATFLVAILGVLAQGAGADTRDVDPRFRQPSW